MQIYIFLLTSISVNNNLQNIRGDFILVISVLWRTVWEPLVQTVAENWIIFHQSNHFVRIWILYVKIDSYHTLFTSQDGRVV